jgi:galactokinase
VSAERKAAFERLTRWYQSSFPKAGTLRYFTAPGRTELGGNHTDHNHGKVLAAAVQLEAAAVAEPCQGRIEVRSGGWDQMFVVDLADLSPRKEEEGTTEALLRGVAYEFQRRGHKWGGFRACVESSVLGGSGLSSSAAFEVLAGSILNALYNDGAITPAELAMVGQAAENLHFGKPCGLMDQMASSLGGIITIDFQRPTAPVVRKLNVDFAAEGWSLCIVNTKGSHADLTPEYAAIKDEMTLVARHFGKAVLREVSESAFYDELPSLAGRFSHRALLRTIHFFEENHRVDAMVAALDAKEVGAYLKLVNASGRSSAQYLQNTYAPTRPAEQPIPLALALTERFLAGEGACRVHGGGFAGTIQAYVPLNRHRDYAKAMEAVYGPGSVIELQVRQETAGETKEVL